MDMQETPIETEKQTRIKIYTRTFELLNRHATPIMFTLGLLLVIGGVVLGQRQDNKNNDIVVLPDYSPVISTNSPTALKSILPTPFASPLSTDVPSPVPSSPVLTQALPSPLPSVAAINTVKTSPIKSKTAKIIAKPKNAKPSSAPPADASTSLLAYAPTILEVTATSPLPDYSPRYIENNPEKKVTVTLAVAGKTYSTQIKENSTVIEAMEALKERGLSFRTQHFPGLGEQIIEINGLAQGSGKYWLYTINGTLATQGASTQKVTETTVITWALS